MARGNVVEAHEKLIKLKEKRISKKGDVHGKPKKGTPANVKVHDKKGKNNKTSKSKKAAEPESSTEVNVQISLQFAKKLLALSFPTIRALCFRGKGRCTLKFPNAKVAEEAAQSGPKKVSDDIELQVKARAEDKGFARGQAELYGPVMKFLSRGCFEVLKPLGAVKVYCHGSRMFARMASEGKAEALLNRKEVNQTGKLCCRVTALAERKTKPLTKKKVSSSEKPKPRAISGVSKDRTDKAGKATKGSKRKPKRPQHKKPKQASGDEMDQS